MKSKKLFIVLSVDWAFLSHRLELGLAALRDYNVTIVAVEEQHLSEKIRSFGFEFIALPTTRSGTNILTELKVLIFLYNLYRKAKPDVVHHVTMKPVTYGSIIARLLGIPKVINAITGLGTVFIDKGNNKFAYQVVMLFFKFGFKNKNIRFILQNVDDYQFVKDLGLIDSKHIYLIKGAGVDLEKFPYTKEPADGEKIRFLLPARMLWDKGVGEYVDAGKSLHSKYKDQVEFIMAGGMDKENKTVISEDQLNKWNEEGYVNWIGFRTDMVDQLKQSHVVVLPSYQEGLPKSLIEACAIGRPVVTTDVPGCRDIIQDGENGLLVNLKDSEGLANAMEKLIIDKSLRVKMGNAGREKAEEIFDVNRVVRETLAVYKS